MLTVLLTILSLNVKASEEKYPKVLDGMVIEGETMLVKSEALLNWRAACRDFRDSRGEKERVADYDCGEPTCKEEEGEFYCLSTGSKTIVLKEKKD